MSVQYTVHCLVDEEPKFDAGTPDRAVAVRLSISAKTEGGEPTPDEIAIAVAGYRRFLDEVVKLHIGGTKAFQVFAFDDTGMVRLEENRFDVESEVGSTALSADFRAWFEDRVAQFAPPQGDADRRLRGFVSRTPGANDRTVVSEVELDAHHVLTAAASWPAPLPHRLGLAFRITVRDLPPTHRIAVVPCPGGLDTGKSFGTPFQPRRVPKSATENYENVFDISYVNAPVPPGKDDEPPAFRTCQVISIGPPETGHTLIGSTGFIENHLPEEVATTVRRIENRAGSLFTGHQAAAGVRWVEDPTAGSPPSGQGHSSDDDEKSEALLRYWLGCLAWQAAAMLATSFDTVLLALQMPGRHADRDGHVLAPFLDILVRGQFDVAPSAAPPADPTDASEASVRRRLRRAIRAGLTSLVKNCNAWRRLSDPNWLSTRFAELTSGGSTGFASALISLALTPEPQAIADLAADVRRKAKDTGRPLTLAHLAQRLATELAPLHDGILSEDGCEKTVLLLLRSREVEKSLIPDGDAAKTTDYRRHVDTLERLFAQGFNGAEAARQSVGSLIADLALHQVSVGGWGTSEVSLWRVVDGWRFWSRRAEKGRFAPEPTLPQEPGEARVFSIGATVENVLEPAQLKGFLSAAQTTARRAIVDGAERIHFDCLDDLFPHDSRRFVPDAVPQPIHLPVTVDPFTDDDDGADVFAFGLAGLGVLIREEAVEHGWAHACLAELRRQAAATAAASESGAIAAEPVLADSTIAPLPTTNIDGRRELFLTYSGDPFTSAAYGDSMSPTDGDPAAVPFFGVDFPDLDDDPTMVGVPRYRHVPELAYGRAYHFAVHIVGRAGTLPKELRGGRPWSPAAALTLEPQFEERITSRRVVSRRTAIGAPRFENAPRKSRLGLRPLDVAPVSRDYRRVVAGRGVVLDLFRNTDGSGAIALRKPNATGEPEASVEVVLRDLQVRGSIGGANTVLRIEIGADANRQPGDDNCLTIEPVLPAWYRGDLTIRLESLQWDEGAPAERRTSVTINGECPGATVPSQPPHYRADFHGFTVPAVWLRISVLSSHTVSFADPTPDRSGVAGAAHRSEDNLVLLGSPDTRPSRLWKTPFDEAAELDVVLPRMGLADFRRWTGNPDLLSDALGLGELTESVAASRKALFHKFLTLLVALDIERFAKPAEAERLDRLPDLAVARVELSALTTDDLVTSPEDVPVDPGAANLLIEMPSLWTLLTIKENEEDFEHDRIVPILERIDAKLRHRLRIEATTADRAVTLEAAPIDADVPESSSPGGRELLKVPAGRVVRLFVRSLVPEGHFADVEGVIHGGLRELATGTWPFGSEDFFVFAGPHVDVETMIGPLVVAEESAGSSNWGRKRDDWAEDLRALVRHVPTDRSGTYRLSLTPEAWREGRGAEVSWHWRRIGWIASATQAWRFLGRPIHSTIDPRRHSHHGTEIGRGSLHLTKDLDDEFFRFEDEAFFARDDFEPSKTPTPLQPIGHETILVRVDPEPKKGATLFRHAFTLRSRHIGAMKVPERDGICEAWSDIGPVNDQGRAGRWFRVAVLALHPGDELSRPQLRALLPLTRRVEDEDEDTLSPPALALLSEAPFAFGGLAARIAAEIRTSVGYGVVPPAGATPKIIGPVDTRKEIGPDPRLSYAPMPVDVAVRAHLDPEGPIGLTHDTDATSAPLFANTALLLHPRLQPTGLSPKVGEENFISVRTLRYLDPNWSVADDRPQRLIPGLPTPISPDGAARWIDLDGDLDFKMATGSAEAPKSQSILIIHQGKVQVDPAAIDPSTNGRGPMLPLCDGATALLVSGWDGRTATITAFTEGRGATAMPVVLASVDVTIPEGARLNLIGAGPNVEIRRTSASAPTSLEWVRTNPDFRFVTRHTGAPGGDRLPVSGLVAVRSANRVEFRAKGQPIWIRSSQSTLGSPTHVQRHMVCLFSQMLTGIGRDIERPLGAAFLHGRTVTLPPGCEAADGLRFVEVETPAEFVGHPPDLLPDRYRSARFDLVAIGAETSQRHLIRIRLLGPNPGLAAAGTVIRSTLYLNDGPNAYELLISNLPKDTCELIVPLELTASPRDFGIQAVDTAGSVSDCKGHQALRPGQAFDGPIDALTWKIDEIRGPLGSDTHERWFEMSLLSRLSTVDVADSVFDFDWIFGSITRATERIDDLDALSAMREAQARCIAVSPRLAVDAP